MGFEDRLSTEQMVQLNKALEAFEKHRDLDALYEDLVSAGLHSEEAEEYVNLLTGDSTLG